MIMVPLVPTAVACVMMAIALAFSFYRGLWFKRQLSRLWTGRRREVLHLDAQNGYYFFMEMLVRWSETLSRISAVLALTVVLVRPASVLPVTCIVTFGIALRAAVLWYIARCRVSVFGELSGFDGYGTFWKARGDWRSRELAARTTFLGSVVILAVALLMLLTAA